MSELIPGLEEFWAPGVDTPESLEREALEKPTFAASRPAKHDFGVAYVGPWETLHDGVCVAVRRNACALARQGIDVFLGSLTHTHWNSGFVEKAYHDELPPEVLAEVGHLTDCQHAKTLARILHFVPTDGFMHQQTRADGPHSDAREVLLARTLAYVALDYPGVSKLWADAFNRFGRIAVPCAANKRALESSGVTRPIDVIPHPMALRDPMMHRTVQGSSSDDFHTLVEQGKIWNEVRFLHVGKWEPRKNQHALVGAFLHAFLPGENVSLTLHCKPFWGAPGYPNIPEESFHTWAQQEQVKNRGWTRALIESKIHVNWNEVLSRSELADLYHRHDVYVSSGRAEGFDLCAFDAKVAGLRMVYMNSGGPNDYAGPGDVAIESRSMTAPPEGYRAPKGSLWPMPTKFEFVAALREARRLTSAEPTPGFDASAYRIDAVGKLLAKSVRSLVQDHDIAWPWDAT